MYNRKLDLTARAGVCFLGACLSLNLMGNISRSLIREKEACQREYAQKLITQEQLDSRMAEFWETKKTAYHFGYFSNLALVLIGFRSYAGLIQELRRRE